MVSWFGLLFLACVLSGVGVVQTRHATQALFRESQALLAAQQRLQVEAEQLRLQRGVLTTLMKVNSQINPKLNLRKPLAHEPVLLPPLP